VYKWNSLTGGADGLSGVPHPRIAFGDWQLLIKSPLQNYYFVLAVFVLCYFALYKVINSSFGQTLLAIRENPLRAEYMGLNTRRIRLKVFVIAGFFCGVSGALFAPFGGTIDPHMAHWAKSGEPVFMTLMGGIGTLFGPFMGTFIYYFLQSLISSRTEYWMLVLGTILITIVMGFPIGILGYIKKLLLLKARKD
jgi:branched-chain amino acid transport system permease protein